MKFKIFKFDSVTSTNDIAIKMIKEKKCENGCVYANKQTAGRGTYGKKWISQEGNLFISIFFKLDVRYPPFHEFFKINPVVISHIIKNLCIAKKITMKYPNDVFVNGKKICGLLQEAITSNSKNFLIIGIGINIVSSPEIKNKYKSTSLLDENNQAPKIKDLISLIIKAYENFFDNIKKYNYIDYKRKAELLAKI